MTAAEKNQLVKLEDAVQLFEKKVIERLTRIETNLESYPEIKTQVYANKENISKVKTVWSTIVGLAFLLQIGIIIFTTMGGS